MENNVVDDFNVEIITANAFWSIGTQAAGSIFPLEHKS